jgi:hypothetical protein
MREVLPSLRSVNTGMLRGMVTEAGLWDPFATELGRHLVQFTSVQ